MMTDNAINADGEDRKRHLNHPRSATRLAPYENKWDEL